MTYHVTALILLSSLMLSCESLSAPQLCRETVKAICEGYTCQPDPERETLLEANGFSSVIECRAALEADCNQALCEVNERAADSCLSMIENMSCQELAMGEFPYECVLWCE